MPIACAILLVIVVGAFFLLIACCMVSGHFDAMLEEIQSEDRAAE